MPCHRTEMALLHRLLQMCRLLLERFRPRCVLRPVKCCAPTVNRRRCRCPSTRRQAGARRHHRQIPGHHARATQLFVSRCNVAVMSTCSELPRTDSRYAMANVRIIVNVPMFENRVPACSGAIPPKRLIPAKSSEPRPLRSGRRYPPHHGWNQSPGPSGSQPKPPHPPHPNQIPNPPPNPKNETYAGAQNGR
jgi:hypothetical protein